MATGRVLLKTETDLAGIREAARVVERVLTEAASLVAPGVATPSEIAMAYEYGLREVKFFPAHLSGGIEMLKALSGVFQQVKFCPTGGIGQHNLAEFLALKNVFVVGGSWLTPANLVKAQQWGQITALAAEATAIARQIKTAA